MIEPELRLPKQAGYVYAVNVMSVINRPSNGSRMGFEYPEYQWEELPYRLC